MALLIGNGSSLYRRDGSLVRTPIRITVNPVERAWYAVADQYTTSQGVPDWPMGGYYGWTSTSTVESAAVRMRNDWKSPQTRQIWRNVTSSHDPENIFYQGLWGISMPYEQMRGEAYLQLGGYRFEKPRTLQGLTCTGLKLRISHGGEICAYQNPEYSSAASSNFYGRDWNASSSRSNTWKSQFQNTHWGSGWWWQRVGLFPNLQYLQQHTPAELYDLAQDEIELETGSTEGGLPRGWVNIWTETPFGCIPTATNPYIREYDLSQDIVNAFNNNGGGWVVSLPYVHNAQTIGGVSYEAEPKFTAQLSTWWFCSSFGSYKLIMELE